METPLVFKFQKPSGVSGASFLHGAVLTQRGRFADALFYSLSF
jgi:hypothetical protein